MNRRLQEGVGEEWGWVAEFDLAKGQLWRKMTEEAERGIKERFRVKALHSIHTFPSALNGSGVRLFLTKLQVFS